MKTRDVIALLRHKSEHIKEKIKPEFFKECADHLEKYEWHDLRKNPEDLPEEGAEIVYRFKSNVFDEQLITACVYLDGFLNDYGNVKHLAWKYIEPFEG